MEGRAQSLCPVCFRLVDAAYEREESKIFLYKKCPEHGFFKAPVWRDVPNGPNFQSWRQKARVPAYPAKPATVQNRGCPFDCGLCPRHAQHTCTGLIEITKRCFLGCPICFADSKSAAPDPSLDTIKSQLNALSEVSPGCNLQLSGGEPAEREDIEEILAMARQKNFGMVQMNTNGMRLGQEKGFAPRLKKAGLDSVYLQFDGLDDEVYGVLRGRSCAAEKLAAIEACALAQLGVILVCTVVAGVNDNKLGDLLAWAVKQGPHVRGLHLQPVSSFGRFPWEPEKAPRITLPEIMIALEEQSGGLVRISDFHAPSCEHPLCSFSAVYNRTGSGLELTGTSACCSGQKPRVTENVEGSRISRAFTALHWRFSDKEIGEQDTAKKSFDDFLAKTALMNRFTLSAMAFQDAINIDIERVRDCCIHVVTRKGNLVPFCLYNLTSLNGESLYRSKDC